MKKWQIENSETSEISRKSRNIIPSLLVSNFRFRLVAKIENSAFKKNCKKISEISEVSEVLTLPVSTKFSQQEIK